MGEGHCTLYVIGALAAGATVIMSIGYVMEKQHKDKLHHLDKDIDAFFDQDDFSSFDEGVVSGLRHARATFGRSSPR
jgi:hypothetical protein